MADEPKGPKVFDVAKPGDGEVQIGTKPMIVGHKSVANDPMVKEDEAVIIEDKVIEDPKEEKMKVPSQTQKTIDPVSEDMKTKEKPAEDDQSEGKIIEDKETPVVQEKTEPTKEEDPKKDDKVEVPEEKASEKLENQEKDSKPEKKLDPTAKAMEYEDKLNKLIESKKYNVNIKEVKSSGTNKIYLVFAVFILGLFGLFVLVDTNTVNPGFELPFSIFGDGTNAESAKEADKTAEAINYEENKSLDTSINFKYDPSVWTVLDSESGLADGFISFELTNSPVIDDAFYGFGVSAVDKVNNPLTTSKATNEIVDYKINKLENIKKWELFYYEAIIKRKTSTNEFYVINYGVTFLANENPTKYAEVKSPIWQDPVTGKHMRIGGTLLPLRTPAGYRTVEEAELVLKSEAYLKIKNLINSFSDVDN